MAQLTDEQLYPECEDFDLSHGPTRLLAACLYWRRRAVAAKADTSRLDWLEQNGIAIERGIEGEWRTLQYRRYGSPIRGPERMTLREAIDAQEETSHV